MHLELNEMLKPFIFDRDGDDCAVEHMVRFGQRLERRWRRSATWQALGMKRLIHVIVLVGEQRLLRRAAQHDALVAGGLLVDL